MIVAFVSVIVTMIVFSYFTTLGGFDLLLIGGAIYFIYLAHLFWSAEMDIMNPQYDQYATFSENNSNNPNESKSTIFAFLIAFAIFAVSLLLAIESMSVVWIKIFIFLFPVYHTINIILHVI